MNLRHNLIGYKQKYLMNLITLLLILSLSFYVKSTIDDLNQLKEQQTELFNESQQLFRFFNDFQRALGYGGFIHNIKEYLLYKDDYHLNIIKVSIEDLEISYENLKSYFEDSSSKLTLESIKSFISLAKKSFDILSNSEYSNMDSAKLNELLELESPEALSKIISLETFADTYNRNAIIKIKDGIEKLVSRLIFYIVILIIIMIAGLYLTYRFYFTNIVSHELKEINDKLLDSEEWLEATVNIAHIGGLEIFPGGFDIKLTNVASSIFGITNNEDLNIKDVLVQVPKEYRDTLLNHIKKSFLTREPFELELPFIAPNKLKGFLHINFKPIISNDKVIKLRGVLENISERKTLEEQLRQSQKMEAIGQLAGGIAHDFNNMLTGIIGCAEILSKELAENSKLSKFSELIVDTATQAAELTGKLLSFSRKGNTVYETFDINESIGQTSSMLTRSINKSILIKNNLNAQNSLLYGDRTQIQNMLLNLGINARDAMPDGGVLTFTTRNVSHSEINMNSDLSSESGQYIEIDIEDTGFGMSEDTQQRIFEPFFTTKNMGKGTGLGLSVVYNTIKEHKGVIEISSAVNSGSLFKILLPILIDQTLMKLDKVNKNVHGSGKILIVDDESIVRIVTNQMLSDLGYSVLTADSGQKCLDIYKENNKIIDLVILDIIMPNISGSDVFYELKKLNPNVKVLFCSGYSQDIRIEKLLSDGALGFIQKPFNKLNLSIKVSEIIT